MEIIGQIYEALDNDQVLAALPALISAEIGSRSCTLQLFNPEFAIEEMFTDYFDPDMDSFYTANNIHLHDEWAKAVKAGNLNRSIRVSDFLSADAFRQSFFYNEFIRRFGDDSAHCLSFASTRPDGGLVAIGVHRGRASDDFSDAELRLLEGLRPHITRMAVLRRNLSSQREKASGALMGINQIEDAYLVLAADRTISFANSAADALLSNSSILEPSDGRLYLYRPKDDQKLGCALNDANQNCLLGRLSFLGRDKCGAIWRFTLAPKVFKGETRVLVWIDRCQASASAPDAMQQIYDLTNAETPILIAVSQGMSAAEIADRYQISITTVRTHIQHIYQKTEVRKASQLAQLVASFPRIR